MKYVIPLIFLLAGVPAAAQLNPDSLGMDDNPLVNDMEARYFNIQVQHYRGDFEFQGKRVGLFMENKGRHMMNKKEYFDNWAKEHWERKDLGKNQFFELTPEEKELSNGFDAIIVSWSETKIDEKQRAKLVKKLKSFRRASEMKTNPF